MADRPRLLPVKGSNSDKVPDKLRDDLSDNYQRVLLATFSN
jgi:hypothetical protein